MRTWADYILTLPLPPSANALVTPFGFMLRGKPMGRLIATSAGRKYRETVHELLEVVADSIEEQGVRPAPLTGPLELYVTFVVPTIASDGANRLKALEDALTGIVWVDDKQVAEWHLSKMIGPPGVTVTVKRATQVDPELERRLAKSSTSDVATAKPKRLTKTNLKLLATPAEYRK